MMYKRASSRIATPSTQDSMRKEVCLMSEIRFSRKSKAHLRLPVQQGDKRRQFAVQLSVLSAQAVHRGRRNRTPACLSGSLFGCSARAGFATADTPVSCPSCRKIPRCLSCAVPLCGLARTFDDRRLLLGDQAVHRFPLADALHDVQQVRLFGHKQHRSVLTCSGCTKRMRFRWSVSSRLSRRSRLAR